MNTKLETSLIILGLSLVSVIIYTAL